MKYLNDYQDAAQTALFNKTGSFFAFGDKQFDEAKKDGVKYVNMGAGLICPDNTVKELINGLDSINKDAVKQDVEENGIKNIIWRELANHECQITMDIADAVSKLENYPITKKEITAQWKPYFQHCVDNDYF